MYEKIDEKRSFLTKAKHFLKDSFHSIFGPVILLICFIFRVKTGYKDGEKLILLNTPEKRIGRFKKVRDSGNAFTTPSIVLVEIDGKDIAVPEHLVKQKSYLKRFLTSYEFNAKMIKGNRRLGKSHPFLIMKIIYNLAFFAVDVLDVVRRN